MAVSTSSTPGFLPPLPPPAAAAGEGKVPLSTLFAKFAHLSSFFLPPPPLPREGPQKKAKASLKSEPPPLSYKTPPRQ